jgi:hypothetical protein
MRCPYPTVHIEHEGSVPFPSGSVSKPTLAGGRLPLKFCVDNSHQAFKLLQSITLFLLVLEMILYKHDN